MDSQLEIRKLYLEDLTRRMKETSAEANRFSGRFLFGGLVAVIAAINVDLVFTALSTYQIIGIGSTAMLLGLTYFIAIRERIERLEKGYQKCKYLYEFIATSSLMAVEDKTLAKLMEDWRLENKPNLGSSPNEFEELLSKLHKRHKVYLDDVHPRGKREYIIRPMAVVVLVLIIKGIAVYIEATII